MRAKSHNPRAILAMLSTPMFHFQASNWLRYDWLMEVQLHKSRWLNCAYLRAALTFLARTSRMNSGAFCPLGILTIPFVAPAFSPTAARAQGLIFPRGRLFERTSDLWQPGLGPTSGLDASEGSVPTRDRTKRL
jgi:hypothetical protein